MTNADKIRAMTDEKLARLLLSCISCKVSPKPERCGDSCYRCTLDWLKQEAEE